MKKREAAAPVRTRIWLEEPEIDNPFAPRAAFCHGYDVYGEMIGRARWTEMLFLLFRGEAPAAWQADLLEALAIALADPGPRDPSVHAAMCGGVGGSTAASCLMAALSVGAGGLAGGREVFRSIELWEACGTDLAAWQRHLAEPAATAVSIWPETGHAPGFDPHGVSTPTIILQTLATLAGISTGPLLRWLQENLRPLEDAAGIPLAMSGVAAAAFCELGFSAEQGEMLHLLLRLPGAAAHALEHRQYGHKKFPFFNIELENDPAQETP